MAAASASASAQALAGLSGSTHCSPSSSHSHRLALPGGDSLRSLVGRSLTSSPSALRFLRRRQPVFRSRRAGPARAAAVETLEAAATDALVEKSVNTIRFLAIDAVEKANSGHPGLPMGCAPMGHILYDEVMKYNPKNPYWFNRDRFVLSAGHGCMLHYALLHLAGYDSVKVRPLTSLGSPISLRERWQLDDRLNLVLLSVTFVLMWDERLEFDFSLYLFNCLISVSGQISTGFDE
ncbi:hypothetical protein B296_00051524 [Ensete ventricosum]|uniref:Transketolase N-terminal domain-containing protein n=1 Tax=Ensete ventricosum TaxID=4639 RepID=A0A426YDX4_ENSVE|nr:hypothetical protein B296_00051524 [Ensete ventricosum]